MCVCVHVCIFPLIYSVLSAIFIFILLCWYCGCFGDLQPSSNPAYNSYLLRAMCLFVIFLISVFSLSQFPK